MSREPENEYRPELAEKSLLEFMPAISPRVFPPYHFKPIVDLFERAYGGNIRAAIAAPRQHGKTTLVKHALPWIHLRHPQAKIFYATYAQEYTEFQSRDIRRIYRECGIKFVGDHNRLDGWGLTQGGSLAASSVDGRGNGLGADVVVIDDPYKGPEEAYEPRHRDKVHQWALQVVMPMLAPGGSMMIIASRWDEDDESGRMILEQGFDEVCIPAIDENGCALCPDGPDPTQPRNLEFLMQIRDGRVMADGTRRGGIGLQAWQALYQGKPPKHASAVFVGRHYFTELPTGATIRVLGVDCASSSKKRADWSVCIVLAEYADTYYILDVTRVQARILEVEKMLTEQRDRYPGVRMASYVQGPEVGTFDLLFERGLEISRMPARWSKRYRAQKTSILWNQGRIKMLAGSAWCEEFAKRMEAFTGKEDGEEDDEPDALVSGVDYAEGQKGSEWAQSGFTFGQRRQ